MPRVLSLHGRADRAVPDGVVYIGGPVYRGGWNLPASKWANAFKVGCDGTREEVIAQCERWLRARPDLMAALLELRGRDLACWCAPLACHGDVLLKLANAASHDVTPVSRLAFHGDRQSYLDHRVSARGRVFTIAKGVGVKDDFAVSL
jgi:hypothetical protein